MPSYTAEYWFIELALGARSLAFSALEAEMDSFKAEPLTAFESERQALLAQVKRSNPGKSEADLSGYMNSQMQAYSPEMQFYTRFGEAFAAEAVAITVLSQALAEATINAALALGLAHIGKQELFPALDRAEMKEKWTVGPLSFLPTYRFDRSGALFETLTMLSRRRNSYIHSKVTLRDDEDRVLLEGSRESSMDHGDDGRRWLRRFLELPYDLHRHLLEQVADGSLKFALEFILKPRVPH